MFHADGVVTSGTIENLSSSGALVAMTSSAALRAPHGVLELKLGTDGGRVVARTVRVEHGRIAVEFDRVPSELRQTIDAAIAYALRAAETRPVLVVDDRSPRRRDLVARLAARGMTPFAPSTPLEAIDLLTRSHLHVNVALLAPGFGQSTAELHALVSHSFPWVHASDIDDDLDATVDRAEEAWSSDIARLSAAIA